MFVTSGLSGEIRGTDPQPCISGYISSGQLSTGWWEQIVGWGKAAVIPGLLACTGVEVIKFNVPPHLELPSIIRQIDYGPIKPPLAASGALAFGYSGMLC